MKTLERLYNDYMKDANKYAAEQFNKIIKPWLMKKGYSFLSGNGDFYVLNGGAFIDTDEFPCKIYETLMEPVPGTRVTVGCMMPNYKPADPIKIK